MSCYTLIVDSLAPGKMSRIYLQPENTFDFSMSQSDYFWLAAHPPLDQSAAACPPQLLQGYEHEQPPHLLPYHQSSSQTAAAGADQMSCIDFSNPGDIFHFDKSFADSSSQAAAAAGGLGSNVAQQQEGGLHRTDMCRP